MKVFIPSWNNNSYMSFFAFIKPEEGTLSCEAMWQFSVGCDLRRDANLSP